MKPSRAPRRPKPGLWIILGLTLTLVAGVWSWSAYRSSVEALAPVSLTPAPTLTPVRLPVGGVTPASPTPQAAEPTPSLTPTSTATALPAETQTAAFLQSCADTSQLPDGLLTLVDRQVALGRDFEPEDLAEVALEPANLSYRPVSLRASVHKPLLEMVTAMNEAGLSVLVISGFRSYTEQALAYEKWESLYPDRAPEISAVPGHSEHQLGTAVDFSAPYMVELYGDFFNTRFSRTPEGEWLAAHAVEYGFTLSYPAEATEITGYAWEPWHFRYVGSLAAELAARNITLTQYLRQCPPP